MKLEGGSLVGEHVRYDNVFVPDGCFLECEDVLEKLSHVGHKIEPCIGRENRFIQARKLIFEDGEGYLICNFANETVSETVTVGSDKTPYFVDIQSGETYRVDFLREGNLIRVPISLSRGDGFLLYLTDSEIDCSPRPEFERVCEVKEVKSYISRRYVIDSHKGPQNIYPERSDREEPFAPWDDDFSGEVSYDTVIDEDVEDAYLSLGAVNHWAKIYVNGEKRAEVTMPPYMAKLGDVHKGDELKIVVANTIAQACTHTDYFEVQDRRDVGTYHAKMKLMEAKAPAGGLWGPIVICKKK
jgi:hypothetical protein